MIATNLSNAFLKEKNKPQEKHRIPKNMTDTEIKKKLCKDLTCKDCEILKYCLYGQQCIIRNLQKE